MILVDIQVPVLDEVYDFARVVEVKIKVALGEITALIAAKERISIKDGDNLQLYALREDMLLDREASLRQQAVRDGDRLVLI